jgi:hypothetical protein
MTESARQHAGHPIRHTTEEVIALVVETAACTTCADTETAVITLGDLRVLADHLKSLVEKPPVVRRKPRPKASS